jgi:glycosyltransferase involved in cell wall biosynthesis
MLARVKQVPIVLEVRDIWPDAILASGVSRPGSSLAKTLSAISRFLYRHCDRIVVVSPAFVEELATQWDVPRDKISLIVNGVETQTFTPGNADDVRHSLNLEGRFIVSYIGTVGLAHGIRTALDAAERVRENRPQIAFVIVGEGAERASLEQEAADRGLDNVFFLGQKPRSEVPRILRASDACLVLLRKTDAFKQVIPTKMLEFMSSGVPVVVGVDGQARKIIEAASGGLYVQPENVDELVQAIEKLEASPELRRSLGEKGRRHMVEHFSREGTARRYIEVLNGMVTRRRRGTPFV